MSDPTELITVREAIRLLGAELRDDEAAKKMLSSRLKDDLLSLRAKWVAWQFDLGGLPSSAPKLALDRIGTDVAFKVAGPTKNPTVHVLPRTWLDCPDFEADVRRWDWAYGSLVASGITLQCSQKPEYKIEGRSVPERVVIGGAHFIAAEIASLIGQLAGKSARVQDEGNSYDAQEKTIEWVAECIVTTHDKGIDPSSNASDLIKTVNNRLAERGFNEPGQSTVYPFATRIVARYKEYLAQ